MATKLINVQLPDELLVALDRLASATARTRNYLIIDAITEFVSRETWHLQRIQEGLRQVETGEVVPDEQMEAFWASWTTPEALAEVRAAVGVELAAQATG